ncbi:MAG: ATP-binding protein [Flavobacteriales bacterium]
MFKHFKIVHRLTIAFLSLGALVFIIVSTVFYFQFKEALIERTLEQLSSVNMLKKTTVEEAILAKKNRLMYHAQKKDFIGLVNASKELNLGNLENYVFPDSLLKKKNAFVFDVSKILNSDSLLIAYFIPFGKKTFVFIEFPSYIEKSIHERTGMGATGESYIVGHDGFMRTNSRFFPAKKPLTIEVKTEGVSEALAGREGRNVIKDYRNVSVFSAYRKINIEGLQWILLSEIDEEEAIYSVEIMRNRLLVISAVFLLLIVILSVFISNRIAIPIKALENVVLELAKGSLPKKLPAPGDDEIGKMAAAIEKLVFGLEKSIVFANKIGQGDFEAQHQLLSEEDALGKAMEAMRNQLKELTWQSKSALIQGQEEERTRLSQDIHDGVGPLLTSIKLQLGDLKIDEVEKQRLKTLIDDTITEMRRVSYNLMPSVLLDFGAGAAIKNMVEDISKSTRSSIVFLDDTRKNNSKINKELNVALYRIAQETLNNAIKHAEAKEIKISITEFEDKVCYFISDNGKGFRNSENKSDFSGKGLKNIKERAALFNGEFFITSDEQGTIIELEIPL